MCIRDSGNSALYFINCEKVKKVYAYETYEDDYLEAKSNLHKYLLDSDQVEIFRYGISSDNGRKMIRFKYDTEYEKQEQIEFKDACDEFAPIIHRHADCNVILKIDSEREEYNIINRLISKLFCMFFCFQKSNNVSINFIITDFCSYFSCSPY